MIPAPRQRMETPAAQKAMAEEILGKLADGAPFDRMAQMYSEDSHAGCRAATGVGSSARRWRRRWRKWLSICRRAGSATSSSSEPNFYILKVEEKRGGDTPSFAKLRPEIEKKLIQEESQRQQEIGSPAFARKPSSRSSSLCSRGYLELVSLD